MDKQIIIIIALLGLCICTIAMILEIKSIKELTNKLIFRSNMYERYFQSIECRITNLMPKVEAKNPKVKSKTNTKTTKKKTK